jgi:hypothetical protein
MLPSPIVGRVSSPGIRGWAASSEQQRGRPRLWWDVRTIESVMEHIMVGDYHAVRAADNYEDAYYRVRQEYD